MLIREMLPLCGGFVHVLRGKPMYSQRYGRILSEISAKCGVEVITLNRFVDSPFEAQLEVVATLAESAFEASIEELRKQDELIVAMRGMLKNGVSIDEISAATGLPPQEIRRRTDRHAPTVPPEVGSGRAQTAGIR